jgi:hypothetical protein
MVRWVRRVDKEYIDKFLKIYNVILLYVFLISICIPIVMYILNPSAYIYETEVYDINYDHNYQTIDSEQEKQMRKKINLYSIVGTTCILGMMISNPDTRKKIKTFYKSVSK